MLTIGNGYIKINLFPKRNDKEESMNLNLKRLKAERVAKGLTQDEIAKRIGLTSRVQYAKRENGTVKIDVEEFIKIIQALGYTENDLSIFFTKTVPEKERLIN